MLPGVSAGPVAAGITCAAVAANACTDATVALARAHAPAFAARGWGLVVLDLAQGGKLGALAAGEHGLVIRHMQQHIKGVGPLQAAAIVTITQELQICTAINIQQQIAGIALPRCRQAHAQLARRHWLQQVEDSFFVLNRDLEQLRSDISCIAARGLTG